MSCNVCGNKTEELFKAQIMGKYNVQYYECPSCKFIQTEDPYWYKEAYDSAINNTDTGLLARNLEFLPLVSTLLYVLFTKQAKFVDYGGGYGVFTRLMRDVGFDYFWTDKFCENIHAKGFEWDSADMPTAITVFETFEHFVIPREEIEKLLTLSRNIVFSTVLAPESTPRPEDWWYYGREHGQHLSFYRPQTLRHIASEEHLFYTNFGNLHVFTEYPIAPTDALIIRKGAKFIFPFIKKMMKSKTHTDMQRLIQTGVQHAAG